MCCDDILASRFRNPIAHRMKSECGNIQGARSVVCCWMSARIVDIGRSVPAAGHALIGADMFTVCMLWEHHGPERRATRCRLR